MVDRSTLLGGVSASRIYTPGAAWLVGDAAAVGGCALQTWQVVICHKHPPVPSVLMHTRAARHPAQAQPIFFIPTCSHFRKHTRPPISHVRRCTLERHADGRSADVVRAGALSALLSRAHRLLMNRSRRPCDCARWAKTSAVDVDLALRCAFFPKNSS